MSLPELRSFKAFVRKHYDLPGDAFDELFKDLKTQSLKQFVNRDQQFVDRDTFKQRCALAGFKDDAGPVFDLLKDTDAYLTRSRFTLCLGITREEYLQRQLPKYAYHGHYSKYATWRSTGCAQLADNDEPLKTSDSSELSKKTKCLDDDCQSLSSASTADTPFPSKEPPSRFGDCPDETGYTMVLNPWKMEMEMDKIV